MSEEGKHATQEVCQFQFQFQIQNYRNDGIGVRKTGENIHGEKGKEKKLKYGADPYLYVNSRM